MTEWHARYGGPGVMVPWHVERKQLCIYSQLTTCSASEVAAMLQGLLHHDTDAEIETNITATTVSTINSHPWWPGVRSSPPRESQWLDLRVEVFGRDAGPHNPSEE